MDAPFWVQIQSAVAPEPMAPWHFALHEKEDCAKTAGIADMTTPRIKANPGIVLDIILSSPRVTMMIVLNACGLSKRSQESEGMILRTVIASASVDPYK